MADQTANVTLTLTDEMSGKLQQVARNWENLKTKIDDTQKSGQEGSKKTEDQVKKTGGEVEKILKQLAGFSLLVKAPMEGLTKVLRDLPGPFHVLGTTMGAVTKTSETLIVTTGRLVGSAGLGGVAGVALAAAGGYVKLLSSMADASAQSRLHRLEIGGSTAAVKRLGEMVGVSAENAQAGQMKFNALYQDLSRGINSQLQQILRSHGEVGGQLADKMTAMWQSGDSSGKAYIEFLKAMGRENDAIVRQIANQMGIPFAELRRMSQEAENLKLPWRPSREEREQTEQNFENLKQALDEIGFSVDDLAEKFEFGFKRKAGEAADSLASSIRTIKHDIEDLVNFVNTAPGKIKDFFTKPVPEEELTPEQKKGLEKIRQANPPPPEQPPQPPSAFRERFMQSQQTEREKEIERQRKIEENAIEMLNQRNQPRENQKKADEELRREMEERLNKIQKQRQNSPMILPGGPQLPGTFGRQTGGHVDTNQPYVVGEHGPELFMPRTSGNVLASASGGPTTVLRDIDETGKDSKTLLRDIKDILEDIRGPTQSGGGGGGGGFGGGGDGGGDGGGGGGGKMMSMATRGGGGPIRIPDSATVPSGFPSSDRPSAVPPGLPAGTPSSKWSAPSKWNAPPEPGEAPSAGVQPPQDGTTPLGQGSSPQSGGGAAGVLAARRERFFKEFEQKPQLKKQLAALATLEHEEDPTAVVESLMNRQDYTGGSIERGMFGGKGGSFYGPIRKGLLAGRLAQLERDPKRMQRMLSAIDAARTSNLLEGATDQGSGNDPNVNWPGGRKVRHGEVYNDWAGGPGGHEGARRYREKLMRDIAAAGSGSPQAVAERTGTGAGAGAGATTGGRSVEDDMSFLRSRGGHDARMSNEPGGIKPEMAARLAAAGRAYEAATGRKANYGEMFRDYATQAKYYAAYRSGRGGLAARPGYSRHEGGEGTDIQRGGFRDWLAEGGQASQYGLEFLKGGAYRADPVHVQMARDYRGRAFAGRNEGTDGTPDRSSIDRILANQSNAIKLSGNADVNVKFSNVPKGVSVDASGSGALENIRIQKTSAMNTTGSHGTDESNSNHEE
jgi:hypothetical protein